MDGNIININERYGDKEYLLEQAVACVPNSPLRTLGRMITFRERDGKCASYILHVKCSQTKVGPCKITLDNISYEVIVAGASNDSQLIANQIIAGPENNGYPGWNVSLRNINADGAYISFKLPDRWCKLDSPSYESQDSGVSGSFVIESNGMSGMWALYQYDFANTSDDAWNNIHNWKAVRDENIVRFSDFYEDDLSKSFKNLFLYIKDGDIVDCTNLKRSLTINEPIRITKSCTLNFGCVELLFNNSEGMDMFNIEASNVKIKGVGYSDIVNDSDITVNAGATVFKMANTDKSAQHGYHIRAVNADYISVEDICFVGIRSELDAKITDSDFVGVGGLYFEGKEKRNINDIRIIHCAVYGTKDNGIYFQHVITSEISNCRLSKCGGHGIFINKNSTSVCLKNNYVASANFAGIVFNNVVYSSIENCCAESTSIGFWMRGSECINILGCAGECLEDSRKDDTTIGNKGTKDSSGEKITDIPDGCDILFKGMGLVITGGSCISISNLYINMTGSENDNNDFQFIYCTGTDSMQIINPCFKADGNNTPQYDILIMGDVTNSEIQWNLDKTTLPVSVPRIVLTTDSNIPAPIKCLSDSVMVRSGRRLYLPWS